jgi:hypothetical protein
MASRDLADLDPRLRPLAEQVIAACIAASTPVTVVCTLRSEPEQMAEIRAHQSWTAMSKHLPQPPDGLSLAIDLVPTILIGKLNWAPTDPAWWVIARAGVALGLRSGMDWNKAGLPLTGHTRPCFDPGHLELDV